MVMFPFQISPYYGSIFRLDSYYQFRCYCMLRFSCSSLFCWIYLLVGSLYINLMIHVQLLWMWIYLNSGKSKVWSLYPNKSAILKSVQDAFAQEPVANYEVISGKVLLFNIIMITIFFFLSIYK